MGLNTTNFAFALKSTWPQARVQNLAYKNQPFFAALKKVPFKGANMVVGTRYADTQGRSATFSKAQTNAGNQAGVKFTITTVSDYSIAQISNEAIESSDGDEQALLKAADSEIDSAMNSISRSLGIKLFRSGSGSLGQVSVSGSTATFLSPADIANVEFGMKLQASTADGGGSLRDSGNEITVATVDRDAGSFTFSGAISGFATNDYVFQSGDYDAAVKGVLAWLPSTAPGATAFFGVDRTSDVVRLGGVRYDGSSDNPEEALYKAAVLLGKHGARPDIAYCDFTSYQNTIISLGSKVVYDTLSLGGIGFESIRINGPAGKLNLVPDINCPPAKTFMLQMDTWKLALRKNAIHFLDADGMKMLRQSSADGYEVRIGYYGNLYNEAPGWNANCTMPT